MATLVHPVHVHLSLWRCCFRLFVALLFQTLCGAVVSDSMWRCRFRLQQHGGPAVHDAEPEPGDAHGGRWLPWQRWYILFTYTFLCGVAISDSLWRCRFRLQQHGGPAVHDAEPEPGDAHGGHALAAGDPRAAPVLPGLHGMQAGGSGPQGLAASLRQAGQSDFTQSRMRVIYTYRTLPVSLSFIPIEHHRHPCRLYL